MAGRSTRRVIRGYVSAAGRLVHYRRAGAGRPVVLLHDSPRSSVLHLPLLEAFSDSFTVFALDTPGYGQSDPLPAEPRPEIDDYGDALAAALIALGLDRPVVYAYHTSSKIALSCAVRHPGRIGRLVVDGLSLPEAQVPAEFIDAYMSPFEPDAEGAYIGRQWTKIRDLHRFFPWFERRAERRLPMDEPTAEAMHAYAMDLFMAAGHYSSAYSAAMRYRALEPLRRLTTPATFLARANDVLYPFLDVVAAHRPDCAEIERLPADDEVWRRRLREIFSSNEGGTTVQRVSRAPSRDYEDFDHGQVHLRQLSEGAGAVLVLHEPPGSGQDVESLARSLAGHRVIAPDLPGCGLSDPLAPDADCEAYGRLLGLLMDRLGADHYSVVAFGLSVPFALALAAAQPSRVSRLLLDGMPLLERGAARDITLRYAPPIRPSREGLHFHATWHRLRDEQLQWPWYDGSQAARRTIEPDLDGQRLHHRLVATLQQPEAYGDACRAALAVDLAGAMGGVDTPLTVLDASPDPRYRGASELAASASAGTLAERPATADGLAAFIRDWLLR